MGRVARDRWRGGVLRNLPSPDVVAAGRRARGDETRFLLKRSGRLVPAIAAHMAYNAVVFAADVRVIVHSGAAPPNPETGVLQSPQDEAHRSGSSAVASPGMTASPENPIASTYSFCRARAARLRLHVIARWQSRSSNDAAARPRCPLGTLFASSVPSLGQHLAGEVDDELEQPHGCADGRSACGRSCSPPCPRARGRPGPPIISLRRSGASGARKSSTSKVTPASGVDRQQVDADDLCPCRSPRRPSRPRPAPSRPVPRRGRGCAGRSSGCDSAGRSQGACRPARER